MHLLTIELTIYNGGCLNSNDAVLIGTAATKRPVEG